MARIDFGERIDGDGDKQANIIAAFATTSGLALIAVIFRFVARRMANARLWLDDWFMLSGLVISLGFTATVMYWISIGLGKYIGEVTPESLSASYELIFASEIICIFGIGVVKFAVIAFYWRILGHTTRLRIVLWVFTAINAAWVVALFFTVFFQCIPVQSFWDKTLDYYCGVDMKAMLIANMIPNFLTDIALVCLPIFYIPPRINTSYIQKMTLYILFALGFFVTVAPIVRLVCLASLDPHSRNVTWDFVDYLIWTGVEINVAIVAGCLPSLKPILSKVVPASFIPAGLRDHGRKDWIASPDQTWLQEPVSISTSSRNNSAGTILASQGSGSRVRLMDSVGEVAMVELEPQRSRGSDRGSFMYKTKSATTIHEV